MLETGPLAGVLSGLEAHLHDIADAFVGSPQSVADQERIDLIRLIKSYSGEDYSSRFPAARVEEWLEYFGEDLSLSVTILDTGKTYTITKHSKPELAELLKYLDRYEVAQLTASLDLRKVELIRQVGSMLGATPHAVFLSPTSLRKRCTLSGVEALYQAGVISVAQHTVVAVLDADGLLQSRLLTVVGMRGLYMEAGRPLVLPQTRGNAWERIRTWRDQNTFWDGMLSEIPPDAFQVRVVQSGLEAVRSAMLGLSDVLSILQLCAAVAPTNKHLDGIVVRNSGPSIHVPKDALFDAWDDTVPRVLTAPFRTYRWVFLGEDEDKLDIVRDLMERELRAAPKNPLDHLLRSFGNLLDSSRASYATIRKKAFESYIRVRGEALASVDAFAVATQANIDKVRDDMLNRVLQFFAAVVAFVTVNVLKPDISRQLQVIGLLFVAIYVILIIIFQMLPSWWQYEEQRARVKNKVNAYAELSLGERRAILNKVPAEFWNSFSKWYFACLGMYVLELVALSWGIGYLLH